MVVEVSSNTFKSFTDGRDTDGIEFEWEEKRQQNTENSAEGALQLKEAR